MPGEEEQPWDHESHEAFYDYYAEESQSPETLERFQALKNLALHVIRGNTATDTALKVADVGCGAGTQSLLWARDGHEVHGLDVNKPLIDLARRRAEEAGIAVRFHVGSAVDLPWEDASMEVCLVPELLEHVASWQACLDEFARVVKPGGVLVLTTTNRLCPVQQEFNLPLYSWYPAPLKRHYERLASSTRPELANYAKYPAVNWFSFFSLRAALKPRGFRCLDRFDAMNLDGKGSSTRWIVSMIRRIAPLRWAAHMATPYTMVAATKLPDRVRADVQR